MKKALLLNSGGYDSAVCFQLAYDLGIDVFSLFFKYGQKSCNKERSSVVRMVEKYYRDFNFHDHFRGIEVEMPWAVNLEKTNYFPMRNFIFLSHALSFAEAKGFDTIITGVNGTPGDGYPDTTVEFFKNIESIANSVNVKIWNPLMNIYKGDVYELGNKLGVKVEDTWSCDYSDTIRCGKCNSCLELMDSISQGILTTEIKFNTNPLA